MENNLRSLGPGEATVILSLQENGRSVVRTDDIVEILSPTRSKVAARKIIRNLVRKGWLSRIIGGRYMLLPPEYGSENIGENNIFALAAAAVSPSYIGWWSAASFHGFTTQRPMTVFVAVPRQTPPQVIDGSDIRFISIAPRKFFGDETCSVYGRDVSISSPEKTVVDCLDHPELCGGATELTRIIDNALGAIDIEKLMMAVLIMKSRALLQRLGFLADLVGRPLPEDFRQMAKNNIPKTYRSHFAGRDTRPDEIGYVKEWGLFVHARPNDLLAEAPIRTEFFHTISDHAKHRGCGC